MSYSNPESHSRYPCLTQLGDISIKEFLRDYWQQKPLLIRQAFKSFESPISADELAGLSLDDDVVSRLIIEHEKNRKKKPAWTVEHGPISEIRYSQLPEKNWTLLVQHVDNLEPSVNEILNAFRFIPNWRLDDIMVSYATDGGGVGPHFDYYDVFLLQAEGKRRWRTGQQCDSNSELVPNESMKILSDFKTIEDWVCEPGDLLYVPAQTAHWGEALGECITYSIGFRAPSDADLLLDLSQHIAEELSEDNRYRDKHLQNVTHPGEINEEVINDFHQKLSQLLKDKHILARWLAEFSTQKNNPTDTEKQKVTPTLFESNNLLLYDVATKKDFDLDCMLKLAPFHRCVFLPAKIQKNSQDDKTLIDCYINGTSYKTTLNLAKILSSYTQFSSSSLDAQECDMIETIIADQYIMITE